MASPVVDCRGKSRGNSRVWAGRMAVEEPGEPGEPGAIACSVTNRDREGADQPCAISGRAFDGGGADGEAVDTTGSPGWQPRNGVQQPHFLRMRNCPGIPSRVHLVREYETVPVWSSSGVCGTPALYDISHPLEFAPLLRFGGTKEQECQACRKRLSVKSFPRRPNGIGRYDVCRACIDDGMRAADAKRREEEAKQRAEEARKRKQQEQVEAARRAIAERERAEQAERRRQDEEANRRELQARLEEFDSAVAPLIDTGDDASDLWNLVPSAQREKLRDSLFESWSQELYSGNPFHQVFVNVDYHTSRLLQWEAHSATFLVTYRTNRQDGLVFQTHGPASLRSVVVVCQRSLTQLAIHNVYEDS